MSRTGENIYYRKDNRWEGRYHKGRKADGKIKYGYVYGVTYDEVKMKLAPLKRNTENTLKLFGKSAIYFNEWSQRWLNDLKPMIKPSTYSSYYHKLKKYLWEQLGDLYMFQLNQEAIKNAIRAWQKAGLSLASIKIFLRLLNQAMKYALKQGLIEDNPCENLLLPKIPKERIHALSRSEQRQLEAVVESDEDTRSQAAILALRTGMRIGEIAALRWDSIDFEREVIHVSYTYQRIKNNDTQKTELYLGPAKSQASQRVIPMSAKVRHLLLSLREKSNSEFVFTTKGKPCEPRLITYHFHRIRKKARLENIHFHQLRHTFATRCLEATANILPVSRILGHSSVQLTTDIYYDSLIAERIAVIQSMEYSLI